MSTIEEFENAPIGATASSTTTNGRYIRSSDRWLLFSGSGAWRADEHDLELEGFTLDQPADHVGRLAAGEDKWTMTVPSQGTDSDMALMSLLDGRLPTALNALQAVLDLHKPVEVEPSDTICGECSNTLPNGRFLPIVEYPCPTVQAIQDAIGDHNG